MKPIIDKLLSCCLMGIIRMPRYEYPAEVARALKDGGLQVLEFTLSGEGALHAIELARHALPRQVFLGAGTVLNPGDVNDARSAGAEFIVTPTLSIPVIEACQRHDLPIVCGALTPTEIFTAMQAGADLVKLFPARLGGAQYLRDLLAPLPGVKLVPTGGVTSENAQSYLEAGAVAVAIGGSLVDPQLVIQRKFFEISERGRRCVEAVARYKSTRGENHS